MTHRRNRQRMMAALVASLLVLQGCYGSFYTTQELHDWIDDFENKWAEEGMFLLAVWVPLYGLAILSDVIIFNAIEFWTGYSPYSQRPQSGMKRLVRGDAQALLVFEEAAGRRELVIRQSSMGVRRAGARLFRVGREMILTDERGRMLFVAHRTPSGDLAIYGATGEVVVRYSHADIQRQIARLRDRPPFTTGQ